MGFDNDDKDDDIDNGDDEDDDDEEDLRTELKHKSEGSVLDPRR